MSFAERPRTLQEVCDALNIASRPAEALVSVSTALGLLEERDGRYALTPVAEDYLLEESATYFGGYFDQAHGVKLIDHEERGPVAGERREYGRR